MDENKTLVNEEGKEILTKKRKLWKTLEDMKTCIEIIEMLTFNDKEGRYDE